MKLKELQSIATDLPCITLCLFVRVGISEKGTATLELSVSGKPGHSSFPPAESAIGILAAAVARLEENPQPSLLAQGPEAATFKYLAPHVSTIITSK
jgi:acetylornithine deacetylase/succinyl-diaminopimelate desuccinylase-like protein